jgi:hypothetical protein
MHATLSDRFPLGLPARVRRQIPITLHIGEDTWTIRVVRRTSAN